MDIFCLGRIEATGTFNHFVMVFTPSFDPCHANFWKIKMVDMFDIIKSGPLSLDNQWGVDDIEPEPSRKNNWPDDAGAKAAMEKFKKQRNVVPWFGFKEVTMEHRSTYFLRWFRMVYTRFYVVVLNIRFSSSLRRGSNLFRIRSVIQYAFLNWVATCWDHHIGFWWIVLL